MDQSFWSVLDVYCQPSRVEPFGLGVLEAMSAGKPVVVRCMLEGKSYSSAEIDKIFSASKAQGKSLYYVEEELLQTVAPDIIFTQDVCEVCQIDTA